MSNFYNTSFGECPAQRYFEAIYEAIDTTLTFDPQWANGTGYYDRATYMVQLPCGGVAKSRDINGRKLIFIGLPKGTLVIFPRYAGALSEKNPLTYCEESYLVQMFQMGPLVSEREFCLFFGRWAASFPHRCATDNIGHNLSTMLQFFEQEECLSFYLDRKREGKQSPLTH